jgi:hypothetical protein
MEKKVFNFKYYEAALKELWEKRVPDIRIAGVLGVGNTVISRYRRSFKLPFVVSNTKVTMSDEDIKQVFVKHNCCDFSDDVKYGGTSNKVLVQREVVNEFDTRKLISQDFFNPDTCQLALERFFYYNLFAPRCKVIQYLDELFIRFHKKPLSKEAFRNFYSKALSKYEAEHQYAYRFAQPVFATDAKISELFVVYLIIHFAYKAKNKNCNPKFISKYCEFIYEVGPIKQSYLAELYAVLGIAVRDDDYVPTNESFKEERRLIADKESNLFVPFPYMLSKSEVFALPAWAAKKYETWLSAQVSKKVSVPGITQVEPVKVIETSLIDTSEEVTTDTEEVITDNVETLDVKSNNDVSEVAYTMDNLPSSAGTLVVHEMSANEKRDIYFKALIDAAVGFVSTEDYYLAASLLQIIHAEKHDKKYTVDLKEGD